MEVKISCFKEFMSRIKKRKIICFGAGQALDNFLNVFQNHDMERKIYYIVDSDKKKWQKVKKGKYKTWLVKSPEILNDVVDGESIILITCTQVESIYTRLEKLLRYKNIDCYFYKSIMVSYLENQARKMYVPDNLKLCKNEKIPKKIHYCWFGGNQIPEKYQTWMESWRKYCPDYEIIEWNESNYNISKNHYMQQAYKSKKWAFVSDYARLDIIYEQGGIYLDTDVELIRSLDELLYQNAFCGFQEDLRVAFGLGFGAIKNFELIRNILEEYAELDFYEENNNERMKASPFYQTKVLKDFGLKDNGELQYIKDMTVYPVTVLSGRSSVGANLKTEHTFAIHHFEGSWLSDEEKLSRAKANKYINLPFT